MNESDKMILFHKTLAQHGEVYEIRSDESISNHRGLKNHDNGGFFIGFLPEVAIMPHDEVKGAVSRHVYRVIKVGTAVHEGLSYQTKAYCEKLRLGFGQDEVGVRLAD
jgi:hypothetical protein